MVFSVGAVEGVEATVEEDWVDGREDMYWGCLWALMNSWSPSSSCWLSYSVQ